LEQEADRAAESVLADRPVSVRVGAATGAAPQRAKAKKLTVKTRCGRPSTRVSDWPTTHITSIGVDLTSPEHGVTLTWSGPNAGTQVTGPFHSSPGAGCCDKDCDNATTSRQDDSRCTPKGSATVHGHNCQMTSYPEARNVTWFSRGGIAFHYYPSAPSVPTSHGCVRLGRDASRIIYDNTVVGTGVNVGGKWKRGGKCWGCTPKRSPSK
jgi:hypothetical protein